MVLGCFIFFGASELAQELVQLARGSGPGSGSMAPQQTVVQPAPAPKNPPPFDPYAGASVPN